MEITSIMPVLSFGLAGLLALGGVFRFIATQVDSLRREIAAVEKTAQLMAEKATETEAKQRHASNNNMQLITTKLELDIRALQKETVRQEQMEALESRLQGALNKIETKLEKLAEATAEMVSIRMHLATVNARLERISDRLDEQHGVAKNTRIA